MGIVPTPSIEQRKLLDLHLELVLEENKKANLTHIVDWEQGQLLHIEDSLQGLSDLLDAPQGCYGDLGSGGGFPGIPLAVLSGRETILIESVAKKTHALERIIGQLGLTERVRTFTGRAEELAKVQPRSFSALTARALSSLPSLLELASPLLCLNGRLICYKAEIDENELDLCRRLQEKLGMSYRSSHQMLLSDGETRRTILVFEKTSEPMVDLPRRPGMAQKRPYKA